ncbi:MAG: hypothetical protein K9G33_03460 [Sneathiella sp.]|nr:hypothetical protein [Sneathiella sp.]
MKLKPLWTNFLIAAVSFLLATLLFLSVLLVEIGHVNPVVIQNYVIAITGLLGFGSVFLQNQFTSQSTERLRKRRIVENVDIVKGFLNEARQQFDQIHGILMQPFPSDNESVEIENRLNWLSSNVVQNNALKTPGYMGNSEFLRGLDGETIEVCLRYATFLENINNVLLFEQVDKEEQYRQLFDDALKCAQLYNKAINLLESNPDYMP